MSMNKKDRCLFGNKAEQLRIYNQRRTINRLEKENKQLKDKLKQITKLIRNVIDKELDIDDFEIYFKLG